MTASRKIEIVAALTSAAAAAVVFLTACGASAPAHHAAASPAAVSTPGPAAARACAKLTASSFAPAAYDQLVTRETGRLASGGTATRAQVRQARATVAGWVLASCPQFTDLTGG